MNRSYKYGVAAFLTCILLCAMARIITKTGIVQGSLGDYLAYGRTLTYFVLFAVWGISIRNRIVQGQVRQYMSGIAFLMIFWLSVRSVKYFTVDSPAEDRFLWYLYYVGMIYIPCFAVFVALSLGKPEHYRLPGWTKPLSVLSSLLFLLVMTNDLHQCVFQLCDPSLLTYPYTYAYPEHYTYGFGYWIILGWQIVCGVISLGIIMLKNRVQKKKVMLLLPFFPVFVVAFYGILFFTNQYLVSILAGDITVLECIVYMAAFEGCIQNGLIPSNIHYREIFQAGSVGAVIINQDYREEIHSDNYMEISEEMMKRALDAPVLLEGGIRLSGAKIRDGYVLWQEDVGELLEVLEELHDTRDNLEDSNHILHEEYQLEAKEAHIREQDRLYNMIQRDTSHQIDLLEKLAEQFDAASLEEERLSILGKMVVIGAYLKRRSNLIFISDKTGDISAQDMELAFEEVIENLELYGVFGSIKIIGRDRMAAVPAMEMYDFFEKIVERSLDQMSAVTVVIRQQGMCMIINTDSKADFSDMDQRGLTIVRDEDGEWQITWQMG